MRTAAERPSERGFTLLEVLVALAIAGLGLGALFEAASGGLSGVDTAARHIAALRRGEGRLAELGITIPLAEGQWSGADGDGYRWRMTVSPILSHAGGGDRTTPGRTLYAVEVWIGWSLGRSTSSIRLDTYRLGPLPAASG